MFPPPSLSTRLSKSQTIQWVCVVLFLLGLAWRAISGGLRQLPHCQTAGQKVETIVQLNCGALSLLVVLTTFWRRPWAWLARRVWGVSLATTAGLSAVVWGPPMPRLGIGFATAALMVARAVDRGLDAHSRLGEMPEE